MNPYFRTAVGSTPLVLGGLSIWFAIERWLWFSTLPTRAPARYCGNCFLGLVGVPFELGLVGLLVVSCSLLKTPYRTIDKMAWLWAVLGILATPMILGVPLLALGMLMLVARIAAVVFKRAAAGGDH